MTIRFEAENEQTGATRKGSVSINALEKASWEGADKCTGSCQCVIEADQVAYCPKGWPSRSTAAGLMF